MYNFQTKISAYIKEIKMCVWSIPVLLSQDPCSIRALPLFSFFSFTSLWCPPGLNIPSLLLESGFGLVFFFFFYPLQKCSGTIEVNYEMLKPLNPLWLQATLRDLTQKTASGILLSAGNAAWFPWFCTWCVLKKMVNAEKAPYYKICRW